MKQKSDKQSMRNRELARIKSEKPDVCVFCGNFCGNADLAHIMPKSCYPQYYLEPLNLWKAHRSCHNDYDNGTKQYRAKHHRVVEIARTFATACEVFQYFNV